MTLRRQGAMGEREPIRHRAASLVGDPFGLRF